MSDLVSPICPKCHSRRTARVKRVGFFRTVILPYLDLYPWECTGCRSVFTFKSRGLFKRRQGSVSEAPMLAAMDDPNPSHQWSSPSVD